MQEMIRCCMWESEMDRTVRFMKAELEAKLVKNEFLRLRNRFTDIHFS